MIVIAALLLIVCVCQAVRIHDLTYGRDPWRRLEKRSR